jgi:hypothetical protein
MKVEFRRTGERRYAVTIHRPNETQMEMNPAPGYDALMPHDLLHFIVESELRLRQGIFGQLAEGGTAGTFRPVTMPETDQRASARLRRRTVKRGAKLSRAGRQDALDSEQATVVCLHEWLKRSADPARHQQVATPRNELTEKQIVRVCARMDELSARWKKLAVGQSLTVSWSGCAG